MGVCEDYLLFIILPSDWETRYIFCDTPPKAHTSNLKQILQV
jgi:hypothetical protein